ncbi:MAG: glycosyltransferase [Sphingobacteriales bacterium]|nr:MAG: glycosyltransferase [Sphingobacteriales bacterium]
MAQNCSILCIAPYRMIPFTSGGPIGILQLHHYISKICPDHIVGTENNENSDKYAFDLHRVLPNATTRYVPFVTFKTILNIARRFDSTAIICEHPYMAPVAMMVAKKMRIPWFIRSHNIESERFRGIGKKWWKMMFYFEQFAMNKANGVLFITPQDADWAAKRYKLPAHKCHFVPFGTKFTKQPTPRPNAKQLLAESLNIDAAKPLLYFLGALDYEPNIRAVRSILDDVLPRLEKTGNPYEVVIAGKALPEDLQGRIAATDHIQYAGYVQDLELFLEGCDIMLNPMLVGGGIKSKAVEGLSYGKKIVSTDNGAYGLLPEICGNGLYISNDNDWDGFVANILKAIDTPSATPDSFYKFYHWSHIAQMAIDIVKRG